MNTIETNQFCTYRIIQTLQNDAISLGKLETGITSEFGSTNPTRANLMKLVVDKYRIRAIEWHPNTILSDLGMLNDI